MPRPVSILASLALGLILAACGAREPESATGFITENTAPPASATDSRGDGVLRDEYGRPFGYALLGEPLPAFTAPMLDGGTFDSTALPGWSILYVWGVWCGDCRADAPHVAELAAAVAGDPGLDLWSIHTPASAARADEAYGRFGSIEAYFEAEAMSYPTAIDHDASIREALQIAWTPSYLLVDPQGVVRGFRSDLSAAGDDAVADFLAGVAEVKDRFAAGEG